MAHPHSAHLQLAIPSPHYAVPPLDPFQTMLKNSMLQNNHGARDHHTATNSATFKKISSIPENGPRLTGMGPVAMSGYDQHALPNSYY